MTRLLLIEGKSASLYVGRDHVNQWDTTGEPIDLGHYSELYPEIFTSDWLRAMDGKGRSFPQIKKSLKNVEILY